jgi:hypothetical protein
VTSSQNCLYWREWAKVRAVCKARGWPLPERHDLHISALGADKSHLAFTNADFDQVLAAFRAISQPDDLRAQLDQAAMARRRYLYGLRRLAPDPYWKSIARDAFGTDDEDRLTLDQLRKLRMTVGARRPKAAAA